MFVWLLKMKNMLYVNVKVFFITRINVSNSVKTNVNIDVGKMTIEYFIDLLTNDSDLSKAVASFIIQLI